MRTFTIDNSCIDVDGGRYKSTTPSGAAKKAASRLFKKAKGSAKYKTIRKLTFCMREITQGSDKEKYHYKANRVKLTKPLEREIGGVKIVNNFKIVIEADTHKNKLKCEKE